MLESFDDDSVSADVNTNDEGISALPRGAGGG